MMIVITAREIDHGECEYCRSDVRSNLAIWLLRAESDGSPEHIDGLETTICQQCIGYAMSIADESLKR